MKTNLRLAIGLCAALLLVSCRVPLADAQTGPAIAAWGPVSEGFQLAACLPQPAAVAEAPEMLPLTLYNATQGVLGVSESYPEHDYVLTITDGRGQIIPPIGDASEVARNISRWLQPGEQITDEYNLKRMYNLTSPGCYTITATRRVPRLDGEGIAGVSSGEAVLTISADPLLVQTSRTAPPAACDIERPGASAGNAGPRMVAVRPILERHGFRVAWNSIERMMMASKGRLVAKVEADKDTMVLAGENVKMGQPAKIVNGQLCAPGQAISLITGYGGEQVAQGPGARPGS